MSSLAWYLSKMSSLAWYLSRTSSDRFLGHFYSKYSIFFKKSIHRCDAQKWKSPLALGNRLLRLVRGADDGLLAVELGEEYLGVVLV